MARTSLIAAGYVALAAADAALAGTPGPTARRLRYLTKPALMPTLNAAFRHTRTDDTMVRRGVSTAQFLSWGGDVALLGRSEPAFLGGVGSFLGAHLAYVATIITKRGPAATWDRAGLKAALGLCLTAGPVMALAARRRDPDLGAPVAVYSTVLAAMVASSRMLDPELSRGGRRSLQLGAVLFLVSDTLLGAQKFLLTDEHPELEAAVMATYTAGQGLIAAGAAAL